MSVVLTVQRNVKLDSEQFIAASEDFTGTSGDKISAAVPALSTNWPLPGWGGFDGDNLKSIWMTPDVACAVKFIHGAGSVDFTIVAGGTLLWCDTDAADNPFDSLDITGMTITCTALCTIVGRTCVG
jgi:hypothetical protein